MEDQVIDAPISAIRNFNYAGFWIRVAAYIIDSIILWIVNWVLGTIFFEGYNFMTANISQSIVSILLGLLYFSVMESSSWQATSGKRAVGIKVGNVNGERISFMNALGRYLGKILSGLILGVGFMMAGWDDKKQALHDKLADTYVYYE